MCGAAVRFHISCATASMTTTDNITRKKGSVTNTPNVPGACCAWVMASVIWLVRPADFRRPTTSMRRKLIASMTPVSSKAIRAASIDGCSRIRRIPSAGRLTNRNSRSMKYPTSISFSCAATIEGYRRQTSTCLSRSAWFSIPRNQPQPTVTAAARRHNLLTRRKLGSY